ncbi:MAG: hypothetical protein NC086_08445 [Alistipes sp.]|nr:hypothetical protein [Alistipes sp.]
MNRQELLNKLSGTLLLEVISAKVEEVGELPAMLKEIGYIDNKDGIMSEITRCEILDLEPLTITKCLADEGRISISFSLPFILTAWKDKEEIWRITSTAAGSCLVPDIGTINWEEVPFDDMDRIALLSESELVELSELRYTGTECDDAGVMW